MKFPPTGRSRVIYEFTAHSESRYDLCYTAMKLNAKKYRYAVVNFLERPRDDIDEFVCVPQSWIRVRRVTEEQSIVAYPNERPSITQRRVEDGEELSPNWDLYLAVIRRETETYDDAKLYILEKKYGVADEDLCTFVENRNNTTMKRSRALESPVEKIMSKLRVVERTNGGSFSNDNVPAKNETFVYPYLQRIPEYREDSPENDGANITRKPCYPSLELLNSMKQHLMQCRYQNQAINTNTDYDRHTVISNVAEGDQDNPQVLPTEKVSEEFSVAEPPQLSHRSQDSEVQLMAVDDPQGNEDTVEVSSVRDDDSHRSGSPGVSTEKTDRPVGYPADSFHTEANRLARMFKNMDKEDLDSSERVLKIHKSYAMTIESVKQRSRKSSRSKTSELNKEIQNEVETPNVEIRNDVKSSSNDDKDENTDDHNNEDEDEQASKKSRDLRKFVLPPDYDPNDTRWTLKYRENDTDVGLEELIPGSKVYINSIRLAHCLRVSKDCKTLARMLLAEIFSQSALAVCSLTGAKANAFHNNGTYVRPGLDKNARVTMLTYVERHSRKEKWTTYDKQSVVNSIRSRVQEIRDKYART